MMPSPDISKKKHSWITAKAKDVAYLLRKARPLLSWLALLLKLPQASSLMHIREFQKQPQLPSLCHLWKACCHLKMLNLLRVPSLLILVPMSLQATSSPDHTAPELRKMIAMTPHASSQGTPDCQTARNRSKKTTH